ncbi:MAG: hypothetical protein RQ899_11745 [Pseudomonadales bacterium]|nr:hypothetical protein [Pseudomonadales bacterium]
MLVRVFLLLACLLVSVPSMAQVGHPAKGSWSGNLSADQQRVRLLIDAHNGELSGTVNPGRRGVEMSSVVLEPSTWTLTITADMPEGKLVLNGKLENLGSWTNRKYFGTYTLGNQQGEFSFTIN